MKYIMLEISSGGLTRRVPILFPVSLVHDDVYHVMKAELEQSVPGRNTVRIVGAGECYVSVHVDDSSYSSTLGGICPHPEDEMIINSIDYFHGIASKKAKVKKRKEQK